MDECHLVVLCHGLWGVSDHFNYLENALNNTVKLKGELSKDQPCKVIFYRTTSNERYRTYDGIDLCGTRVAEEIVDETQRLLANGHTVTRFSIIGYSLGGLIARYVIGVLEYKGYFKEVERVNFTSFCSPHVGVLTPGTSISVKFFNWFVPQLLGTSGQQMFLKDNVFRNRKDERRTPLLSLMASPKSIFYRSLQSFEHLALYSNIRSDIRTSWWTSGISYINPFEILDKNPNVRIDDQGFMTFESGSKFELKYLDHYAPIILDVNKQIKFTGLAEYSMTAASSTTSKLNQMVHEDMPDDNSANQDSESLSTVFSTLDNYFVRKFKWVIMLFRVCVYLPMWLTWFILNNLVQVSQSTFRILRESSKLKYLIDFYNLSDPLPGPVHARRISESYSKGFSWFENDLHDQGDYFLDSVFDAVTSSDPKAMESVFSEKQDKSGGNVSLTTTLSHLCSIPIDDIMEDEQDLKSLDGTKQEAYNYFQILQRLRLGLSKNQREIVKNLSKLNWQKFPIYITTTNATHAAAIVRHEDPNFKQGETVVRHYCEEVFRS
ncbi:DEKNAAC102096 [Brettanomyces naardenensis]|uniref:DEKNAAC102096 n=1 Tax=Brettanomyces naardenensis TaxID=13370 RepID=A0A448YJP6_BRENA|nr:DEKNAAC102096 [Brettanomyces naardenensis]